MIPGLGGVVEQGSLSVCNDFFEFHIFELGAFYQFVEIIDICFLVFAVVEFDSPTADRGFESIFIVGQLRLFVGHSFSVCFLICYHYNVTLGSWFIMWFYLTIVKTYR